MKISNESKVGIFTAITITILILGYNFLKGRDLFTKTNMYYAEFAKVDGLVPSNPVLISGYRIGQVAEVKPFFVNDSIRFRVEIEVQRSIGVPVNSTIKIFSSDFFGAKAIELVRGNSAEIAENKSELNAYMEPGFVDNLNQITLPLREKVSSILEGMDSTFNGPEGEALKKAMRELPATMVSLKNTLNSVEQTVSGRINQLLADATSISSNLKNNNEKINSIISNMETFTDTLVALQLKQTLVKAESALDELYTALDNINNGNGSLGKLAQDEQLYNNLRDASADLDILLKDLKENPKRYVNFSVFGRKEKKK